MTDEKATEDSDISSPRAILYDASGHDRECDLREVNFQQLGKEQLLWIHLSTLSATDVASLPDELRASVGQFGEIGGIELFDDFYRFTIPLPDKDATYLQFVVGKSWVVTISEHRPDFFDKWIEADQGETLKGRLTSTAFTAALLMRHFEAFREQIASIDISIDRLDDTIMTSREKRSPLMTLAALRRHLSRLRVVLKDHRGVVRGLIGPEFQSQVAVSDKEPLVEVNRMFERLEDDVSRARETVIGSFELYSSRVAQDTNQLIKILTVATVITGIIGAVAGIFGMNFDTPMAHSGLQGFLIVTGLLIASSILFVAVAVARRWV